MMSRTASLVFSIVLTAYFAGAWLTQGFQVWTSEGARRLSVTKYPVAAPNVVLLGSDGHAERLPELLRAAGKITIVNFIYTRCQTVCQTLGSSFQQIQATLARMDDPIASRISLLSVSFDLAHDSPTVLTEFGKKQNAESRVWRMAVPERSEDLDSLLKTFQVVVIPDGLGGFEHNAGLLVIDQAGRLVRVFEPSESDAAVAFARQLISRGALV